MRRLTVAAALLFLVGQALGYECEEEAFIAAKMAVERREGGLNVVDKCTALQVIYQRGRRTIVWLQARYLDGRKSTQWCVAVTVPKSCGGGVFDQESAVARKVVSCPTIPTNNDEIARVLRAAGWSD